MCDGGHWCQSKECFNLLRQIRISRKCYEACKLRKRSQADEEISTDQIKKSSRQQRNETRLASHWLFSICVLQM